MHAGVKRGYSGGYVSSEKYYRFPTITMAQSMGRPWKNSSRQPNLTSPLLARLKSCLETGKPCSWPIESPACQNRQGRRKLNRWVREYPPVHACFPVNFLDESVAVSHIHYCLFQTPKCWPQNYRRAIFYQTAHGEICKWIIGTVTSDHKFFSAPSTNF